MRQHVEPGGLCFEPFSGSGSQIMAGEATGRRVYAMEISMWKAPAARPSRRSPPNVESSWIEARLSCLPPSRMPGGGALIILECDSLLCASTRSSPAGRRSSGQVSSWRWIQNHGLCGEVTLSLRRSGWSWRHPRVSAFRSPGPACCPRGSCGP